MKIIIKGHNQEITKDGTLFVTFCLGDINIGCGYVAKYGDTIEVDFSILAEVSQDGTDSEFVRVDLAKRPLVQQTDEEADLFEQEAVVEEHQRQAGLEAAKELMKGWSKREAAMTPQDFKEGDRVAYIPGHAHGDIRHQDVERGVVSSTNDKFVFVRFKGITSQACDPDDLRIET
jgi:hypothetical protein